MESKKKPIARGSISLKNKHDLKDRGRQLIAIRQGACVSLKKTRGSSEEKKKTGEKGLFALTVEAKYLRGYCKKQEGGEGGMLKTLSFKCRSSLSIREKRSGGVQKRKGNGYRLSAQKRRTELASPIRTRA